MGNEFYSNPTAEYENDYNKWIEDIISITNEMDVGDKLLIYDYGVTGTLKIVITLVLNDEYLFRIDTDEWVDGVDESEVEWVDRTYVEKGDYDGLKETLKRLWDCVFIGIF